MSKIDLERFAEYSDQYEFVDELYKEDSTIPIRLTTDRYNGTIIRYDKIHMTEVYDDEDEATLKFEYEFIENPSEIVDNDPMFNNHIGDILVNIIINTLNGKDDEDRDNDSEQSNSQRGLQSEGSSLS